MMRTAYLVVNVSSVSSHRIKFKAGLSTYPPCFVPPTFDLAEVIFFANYIYFLFSWPCPIIPIVIVIYTSREFG